ncbi:hypothetical protein L5515_015424 [Caenorhabditis briggsae]|uniref:Uncharacterized protein n=1 Tax=Caenorhabditis briggsae TaxID=6238 RepID=A0AAE9EBS4_CAEBR|nr:hypothetical protein L5515_015424 [Caenorhabditis briggsae]
MRRGLMIFFVIGLNFIRKLFSDPEDGLRTDLEVAKLHREAEKSAREILGKLNVFDLVTVVTSLFLEEEIKDDRVNFGKAKGNWFVNNRMKALAEEKDVHVGRIATLNEQWKGATRQAIQDRVEFGKKRRESEEAMRELIEKVEKLENELMQKGKKISEMLAASQNEETDLNKLREEHEQEIGKVRKEVVRLQGLLEDVEEENGRMKNAIESLKEDKKTQASQKEENDLNMTRKEHEEEVGKAQMEVERLQGLLTEVEEENDRMKNGIESLKEDKETQAQESRLEIIGMQQS